jgi:hypothetical protein
MLFVERRKNKESTVLYNCVGEYGQPMRRIRAAEAGGQAGRQADRQTIRQLLAAVKHRWLAITCISHHAAPLLPWRAPSLPSSPPHLPI